MYKRVLLKISGESLSNKKESGIDFDYLLDICSKIKKCVEKKYEISIVVGGGNFWRGRSNKNMDSVTADSIGMLGTIMNSLAIKDAFKQNNVDCYVQTSINLDGISDTFNKDVAVKKLKDGNVVIFGGGTGSPFFSTDTAASLRALEIDADCIIKFTNVDGVYDSDPKINSNAIKYDTVSYSEVIEKNLKVMDLTSITMCKDNSLPIIVTNINELDNLEDILNGKTIGTKVYN